MSVKRVSMRRISTVCVAGVVAMLTLSACQIGGSPHNGSEIEAVVDLPPLSELTPIADPTSWVGPSSVLVGGPTLEPLPKNPVQDLPATVTSLDGEVVQITDTDRVLALSLTGTIAELIYSLGLADSLVGQDISTTLPGYEDLPVVTKNGHSVDGESMLAVNPTVVITDGTIGPLDVIMQLREAGVKVVTVTRAVDPATTYKLVDEIASIYGVSDLATEINDELAAAIAAKEAEIAEMLPADPTLLPRVAFLYIRGTAGIYYLFGEGSGVDATLSSLGAIDVAKEAGWVGERPMTDEALVALDPDIILVMRGGLDSANGVDGLISSKPSVALTTAGENKRIIDVPDTLMFAGGTRIPDILDGLARAIYAPESLEAGS